MRRYPLLSLAASLLIGTASMALAQGTPATATNPPAEKKVRSGADAFADWQAAAPGVQWLIQPKDLPKPFATSSAQNGPKTAAFQEGMAPRVPAGFTVTLFAQGLAEPRTIRVAPNGDVFVVESKSGKIRVFKSDGTTKSGAVFVEGLNQPYGLAFYPAEKPRFVYVAETNRVVRYAYKDGDQKVSGAPEVIIPNLPTGGHWTRDIAFSADGDHLYLSVGSHGNVGEGMPAMTPEALKAHEEADGIGSAWGVEKGRAKLFVADPDGKNLKTFATGIRNCSGLAVEPRTGAPWCATNERDGLGDDLVPDFVTRVQQGGFYGWPWYYIGTNGDPRHSTNARPELTKYVVEPTVLIQAHSAALGMAFYSGKMFPEDFVGDAFVALHGSWNRGKRTGYKVVRLLFENGQPTGVYEDFMTGFVVDDNSVWGRPVGVTVAADGALLVTEDEAGTIWRVSR